MSLLKVNIDDRNYSSWCIFDTATLEPFQIDGFNPEQYKLFTNDVFNFNDGKVEIIHSSIRVNDNMPAVLILADQKTYGRENKFVDGTTLTSIFFCPAKCAFASRCDPSTMLPLEST